MGYDKFESLKWPQVCNKTYVSALRRTSSYDWVLRVTMRIKLQWVQVLSFLLFHNEAFWWDSHNEVSHGGDLLRMWFIPLLPFSTSGSSSSCSLSSLQFVPHLCLSYLCTSMLNMASTPYCSGWGLKPMRKIIFQTFSLSSRHSSKHLKGVQMCTQHGLTWHFQVCFHYQLKLVSRYYFLIWHYFSQIKDQSSAVHKHTIPGIIKRNSSARNN